MATLSNSVSQADGPESWATGAAIEANGVSKTYRMYARPIDRFKQAFAWGRREYYREFWALRDVSFQVRRGEAVGIVGRNGSGKSTLLQIIAGTLMPTEGTIQVRGRVAALLELGSGFNPDFTGRENVYMNGAVLGLSSGMIDAKFADIAAFADIGEFLDQPVRTYSSGMVMRLAFAVSAHVDADILIVDEALAVGDEAFQRKCYGKLEMFRAGGGTVLLVTHSAQTVAKLCDRAVLLDQGRVLAIGGGKPVTDLYQKLLYGSPQQAEQLREHLAQAGGQAERVVEANGAESPFSEPAAASANKESAANAAFYDADLGRPAEIVYGNGEAEIFDLGMYDEQGRPVNVLVSGQKCEWRYRVRFAAAARGIRFGMMVKTTEGVDVAGVSSVHLGWRTPQAEAGQVADVRFQLTLNLAPGTYFLNSGVACLRDGEEIYLQRRVDVAAIRVIAPDARDLYGLAFLDPVMRCTLAEAAVAHV